MVLYIFLSGPSPGWLSSAMILEEDGFILEISDSESIEGYLL